MLQGAGNTTAAGESVALTSTEVLLKPEGFFFLFLIPYCTKKREEPRGAS